MPVEDASIDTPSAPIAALPRRTPLTPTTLWSSPLFWLGAMFLLGVLMPFVPVPTRAVAVVGSIVLTVAYVVVVVEFVTQATRLQLEPARIALYFVASLIAWGMLQWLLGPPLPSPVRGVFKGLAHAPNAQYALWFVLETLRNMALLGTAVTGGSLVARLIKFPNMLGPVCAIIALVDVWGVLFGGIVSQLLTNPATRAISHKAMVGGPTLGAATHSHFRIPLPDIGIGDYLFLGILFAVLHALGMNWRGAVKWVIPFMIVALLSITLSDARVIHFDVPALPGLLFIGLGVAIPNLRYFEYTREEKFALLYAGVFVVILTGGLFFAFTRAMPPDKTLRRALQREFEDRR